MKKSKRLEFDFSIEAISKLDGLIERSNITSKAELLRRALSVYEYLTIQINDGYNIILSKDDDKILITGLI